MDLSTIGNNKCRLFSKIFSVRKYCISVCTCSSHYRTSVLNMDPPPTLRNFQVCCPSTRPLTKIQKWSKGRGKKRGQRLASSHRFRKRFLLSKQTYCNTSAIVFSFGSRSDSRAHRRQIYQKFTGKIWLRRSPNKMNRRSRIWWCGAMVSW